MLDIIKSIRPINDAMPRLVAEQRAANLFGAPDLHLFAMFAPDERRITGILSDLLDPQGRHGQGVLFLNAFLSAIGMPEVGTSARVMVVVDERTRNNRMVDLMIHMPDAVVGIEVKLWAAQQVDQLSDYADHVDAQADGKHRAIVFLADQEPKTAKDRVIRMRWATDFDEIPLPSGLCTQPMRDVLAGTLPSIRAERTRRFLEEFLIWIDSRFGGKTVAGEAMDVFVEEVIAIFEKDENKQAMGAIMLAKNKLHEKIILEIGNAIINKLGNGFEFAADGHICDCLVKKDREWSWRKKEWPENVYIALQADKDRFSHIFYGILALMPDTDEAKEYPEMTCDARGSLDRVIGKFDKKADSAAWWAWYVDMEPPYNIWDADFAARILVESPGGVIANHPEVQALAEGMMKIAKWVDVAASSESTIMN